MVPPRDDDIMATREKCPRGKLQVLPIELPFQFCFDETFNVVVARFLGQVSIDKHCIGFHPVVGMPIVESDNLKKVGNPAKIRIDRV